MLDIRDASPQDMFSISQLLAQLGYPTSEHDAGARLAAADRGSVILAERDAAVLGFASFDRWFAFAEDTWVCRLSAICMSSDARGSGVGRALVAEVESRSKAEGRSMVELSSGRRAERESAHHFYPSLGYRDRSEHHAFYGRGLQDKV